LVIVVEKEARISVAVLIVFSVLVDVVMAVARLEFGSIGEENLWLDGSVVGCSWKSQFQPQRGSHGLISGEIPIHTLYNLLTTYTRVQSCCALGAQ
jgi:hypothetical protein